MNCEEFAGGWDAHVAGLLESPDESHMREHSHGCDACGTKWREHEELTVLLASVIQPLKPPENFTLRLVERLPSSVLRHAVPADRRRGTPDPAVVPLMLAAFLCGMVVSQMSGIGDGRSPMEQLTYAEMLGRGPGMPGLAVLSLASRAGNAFTLLVMLIVFAWILRTSVWNVLFPTRVPVGFLIARCLSVPTIVFGLLRLTGELFTLILSWNQMWSQGGRPDFNVIIVAIALLDQAWRFGFWLTLTVLLISALNELVVRYTRPTQ